MRSNNEEPARPKHSLPSYSEPTPEMHRHMSREDEAELALKNTEFASGVRSSLIALFLITIAAVPAIQFSAELRAAGAISRLPTFLTFKSLPLLPHPADLKRVERTLENDSVVSHWLLPRTQFVLTKLLGAGNEQVYLGSDHWLFYRQDVDHVTGPPFLDAFRMKRRSQTSAVQPDPVKAIVDFRDQLAARGIELVLLPVPVKPGIDGEMFCSTAATHALQNQSFFEFKTHVEQQGVRMFDPTPLLMAQKAATGTPLYLESDTHWRPETMEFVAEMLAEFLKLPAPRQEITPTVSEKEIAGRGDVAAMLKLPATENLYPREKVLIHQVNIGNAMWRPSKDAQVLLLGDSFANVFSLEAMGWGESAGFAEHLSAALRRPLDCILRNSDAAFATREILSNELARGHDRLAGKKLVIWEFAARELSFGDWKLVDLKTGAAKPSRFFNPKTGEQISVSGTIESISTVPRPGTVPYKDHILALHLIDISGDSADGMQAIVYLWSMRDNVWTPAARARPGDRLKLRLRPWSDVSAQYEKFNRTELEDPALQLEEPVWGELVD